MSQTHLPFQQNRIFTLNEPNAPRLNPALACEIGLNESVILLQLEFWIAISNNERDGMFWTYQSVRDMQATFPFWSLDTINRAIKSLEKNGFIMTTTKYNPLKYDKTRWFTLNFPNLDKLESISIKGHHTRSTQNRTGSTQNHTGSMQDHTAPPSYPIDITRDSRPSAEETTTEKTLKTTTTAPAAHPTALPEPASPLSSPSIINDIKETAEPIDISTVRKEILSIIPDKHHQPIVTKFVHETLKSGVNSDIIKSAILYTNAHSKGNTKQYRSYLGKTIDNPNWHSGYLEQVEQEKQHQQEIENLEALKVVQDKQKELLKQQLQNEKAIAATKEAEETDKLLEQVDVKALDTFIETECWDDVNSFMKKRWKCGERYTTRRLNIKKFAAADSAPSLMPAIGQSVVSQPSQKNTAPLSLIMTGIVGQIRPTA